MRFVAMGCGPAPTMTTRPRRDHAGLTTRPPYQQIPRLPAQGGSSTSRWGSSSSQLSKAGNLSGRDQAALNPPQQVELCRYQPWDSDRHQPGDSCRYQPGDSCRDQPADSIPSRQAGSNGREGRL